MLISQREACELLGAVGVARRHAQRVLASGLVGAAVRTRSALLYDQAAVRALADRPILEAAHMWERSPDGFFVARRHVAIDRARQDLVHEVAGGWEAVSPWTWLHLTLRVRMLVERSGHGLPFVCTVGGFVVLGSEIVGTDGAALVLDEPGPWFDGLDQARLLLGPGQPWSIHLGRPEDAPHERIAG